MSTTIETLQVEIIDSSQAASASLDRLSDVLSRIKTIARGGIGLTSVKHQIADLKGAIDSVDTARLEKLNKLRDVLDALAKAKNPNLSSSLPGQITEIGKAIKSLSGVDFSKLQALARAIEPLASIPKTNLAPIFGNLKKIPDAMSALRTFGGEDAERIKDLASAFAPLTNIGSADNFSSLIRRIKSIPKITEELAGIDLTDFQSKMEAVAAAVRPLATEMDKIAKGFESFPSKIKQTISGMEKMGQQSSKLSTHLKNLKKHANDVKNTIVGFWNGIWRVLDVLGQWFTESSDYIEALNLFNVSMREGTDAAMEYATSVQNLMGIDLKQWMNNQGSFQNLVTGYEVVSEKANVMSKNLTQLAYDLSSVFNTDVETAFTKLQSAMSGQVKSLKVWGVDVSVASMKQYILNKQLDVQWSKLNTAQKAILRYNYIMEKTVNLQGDMARTLVTPSNAMRVFNSQLDQLKRQLGNIVSTVVTKVIPVMQVLVEEATKAAEQLAIAYGFELPEIDYSGLDETGVSDLTDDLEEANDQAQKLKRSLLGMDEINILGTNEGVSGSVGSGDYTSNDVDMMDIYDYDFLTGRIEVSDQLRKNVAWVVDEVKDGVKFLIDAAPTLLTLFAAFKAIQIGTSVFSFFKDAIAFTKSIAPALISAMGKFGDKGTALATKLAPVVTKLTSLKTILGVGGVVLGFKASMDGAYDLTKALANDGQGLGWAITNLVSGGVMAVAGGFMVGGPVGALVGGMIALAGAIIGVQEANRDIRNELSDKAFYADYAYTIDDLAEHFEDNLSSVTEYAKAHGELADAFSLARDNASDARENIDLFFSDWESRGTLNSDDVEEMAKAFEELYNSIKQINTTGAEIIFSSLGTAIELGIKPAKDTVEDLLADVEMLNTYFGNIVTGSETRVNDLMGQLSSGNLSEEESVSVRAELGEELERMAKFEYTPSLSELKLETGLAGIDLGGSASEVLSGLGTLHGVAESALSSVDDARLQDISQYRRWDYLQTEFYDDIIAQNPDYEMIDFGAYEDVTNQTAAAQKSEVLQQYIDTLAKWYAQFRDNFEKSVIARYDELFDELALKIFLGNFDSDPASVERGVSTYNQNRMYQAYSESTSQYKEILDGLNTERNWILGLAKQHQLNITIPQYAFPDVEDIMKGINSSTDLLISQILQNRGDGWIAQYATGGFPEDGLFFANSRELVGRFTNGRTAVANNEQIIEGIKEGVRQANIESAPAGGDWVIQIVDESGGVKAETIITAAQRRNRRDGRTVISVES